MHPLVRDSENLPNVSQGDICAHECLGQFLQFIGSLAFV